MGVAPPEKGVVTSSVVRSRVSVEGEGAVLFLPGMGVGKEVRVRVRTRDCTGTDQSCWWRVGVEGLTHILPQALGLPHHFTPLLAGLSWELCFHEGSVWG